MERRIFEDAYSDGGIRSMVNLSLVSSVAYLAGVVGGHQSSACWLKLLGSLIRRSS